MKAWARKQKGFTIVELLIVIVVIGILAAITIAVFSGVQTRAEHAKNADVIKSYAKAFQLYATDNGDYPSTATYPCIGTYAGTNCARTVTGAPGCAFSGMAAPSAAFDTLISPYFNGGKPNGSNQPMNCAGDTYIGAYVNANSANTKNITIQSYFKGNITCPTISLINFSSRSQGDDTTVCRYAMPTLP